MALHQFKTKHNSMVHDDCNSCRNESVGSPERETHWNSNFETDESSLTQEPRRPSIICIKKRPTDPILLYRPTDGFFNYALLSNEQEDLFSQCHKDLIQGDSSNPLPENRESLSDNRICCQRDEVAGQSRIKVPSPVDRNRKLSPPLLAPPINRVPKAASSMSWSVRKNEYISSKAPCPRLKCSLIPCVRNPKTVNPTWDNTTLPSYSVIPEGSRLDPFQYQRTKEEVQSPFRLLPSSNPFPEHLDSHRVAQQYRELFSLPIPNRKAPVPEFINAKRMLVEGIRLVCDEANDTLARMHKDRELKICNITDPTREGSFSPEDRVYYDNITKKANFIQSAFFQLANCDDPEMLEEARRIIPVPLLQRLLQQLQEDSSAVPEAHGIT